MDRTQSHGDCAGRAATDGGWDDDDTIERTREAHHHIRNVELADIAADRLPAELADALPDDSERFGARIYEAVDHEEIPTQSELQSRLLEETGDFATAVNRTPVRQKELMVEQFDDDELAALARETLEE